MRETTETTKTGGGCEIPRREWGAFFLQFSQDHQEWLVDVAPPGEGSSASRAAQGLPFEALALHLDHTDEVLSIIVRQNDSTQEHEYQSISRPGRVMIERAGADVRLHIDSTEGSSTIIRFRRVSTPDYDAAPVSGIPERSP
ncbi:MAG TPA: DUF5335 family protein [Nitrospiraceae bacterium]|nr:DUF5335 family protein [Nitrospiraceae bacterium]